MRINKIKVVASIDDNTSEHIQKTTEIVSKRIPPYDYYYCYEKISRNIYSTVSDIRSAIYSHIRNNIFKGES